MIAKRAAFSVITFVVMLLGGPTASGLIFFDTGDPAHNRETAPGGAWAGSGWQFQGEFKNFLGTMISPRHFVTAQHVGVGTSATTFVHKSFFSGEASDRTYFINPNVNGGTGYWDISGTDLRVFEVYGDFPGYAELYTKSNESGKEVVMMGRGRPRGTEVTLASVVRGWEWGAADKRARWGVNDVDVVTTSGVGDLLVTDFDEAPGTEECHAASGDSGGALFMKDGVTWKLAGIFYAVDGKYDTNNTCADGSDFQAAMFNANGFYLGQDNTECNGWLLVNPIDDTDESRSFASRISSSSATMQGIIQPAIDDAAKTPLQRYDEWIADFGLSMDTMPGEDADHDLQPNVVEYLSGLNPNAVDEPNRALKVEEQAGEKIRLTVRVRLDAEARGLSWEIQGADDLVAKNYTAVTGLTQVGLTRSLSEGVETIEYEIDRPASSGMYYRLEVTLGP